MSQAATLPGDVPFGDLLLQLVLLHNRACSPKMCQGGAADAAKSKVYAPPDAPDALHKFADRYDNVRAPHCAALRCVYVCHWTAGGVVDAAAALLEESGCTIRLERRHL